MEVSRSSVLLVLSLVVSSAIAKSVDSTGKECDADKLALYRDGRLSLIFQQQNFSHQWGFL